MHQKNCANLCPRVHHAENGYVCLGSALRSRYIFHLTFAMSNVRSERGADISFMEYLNSFQERL